MATAPYSVCDELPDRRDRHRLWPGSVVLTDFDGDLVIALKDLLRKSRTDRVLAVAAAWAISTAPAPRSAARPLTAPSTSKAPGTAGATLRRVREVLRQYEPATDAEARIEQGTHAAPPFHDWQFYVPGRRVPFMPVDYAKGQGMRAGGLPVFRSARCGSA